MLRRMNSYMLSQLFLFSIGTSGVFLGRKNIIILLMSLELMLLAINMIIAIVSTYIDDLLPFTFIATLLSVAASETAIGLALIVSYSKQI